MKTVKQEIQESKLTLSLKDAKRFELLPDGWIKDNFTGLDFGPSSEETMTMEEAIKYCQVKGGRLPTLHELHSLVDFTKEQPASNEIFKDMKHDDWYWSCTRTAWNKFAVWCVSFNTAHVYYVDENGVDYVRPVRASQ